MKIQSLQALRFWAALAVVHLHSVMRAYSVTGSFGVMGTPGAVFGRAGVDVFFVIAGLVITLTARYWSAGAFLRARFDRIYPIYFLLVLPWLLLGAAAGELNLRSLIATLLLWPASDVMTAPLLFVGWSLCFEVLFYVCAALILWRPRALAFVLLAYAAAMTVRQGPVMQFLGNPLSLEFMAGAALAFAPRLRILAWLLPLGVTLLVGDAVLGLPQSGAVLSNLTGEGAWPRVILFGGPAVLIVWGALSMDAKPGVFSYLGDTSYALYLIHPLVLLTLAAALKGLPYSLSTDLIIAIGMTLSVLAGWRVHEAVEKPMLAWMKRAKQPAIVTA